MNEESTENKIIEILSGYVTEKGLDLGLSKIEDLLERKKLKYTIASEIEKAQSDFEKSSRNEEFDFQGLIELVKGFSDKDFIIKYTILFSEPNKLEKAKEPIFHICIRDTHAETKDARDRVKCILNNCFSIVEEALKSKLNDNDWIEIGLINKHTDESKQEIIDNNNQNTRTILNSLNEIKASQNASSGQPEKKEITNDNESYIKTFSAKLFLEDKKIDKAVVSLADMYISPSIQDEEATVAHCIEEWYNDEDAEPCLLLYGNAGVGKSSLVAKILADVNGKTKKDKVEFDFDSSEVMAVALRNHTDKINIQLKAEEILKTLFNCDDIKELQDKLLILDGLDELCVLKRSFDGKTFLEKLSRLEYGYHVLVTSRESESYFTEPDNEEGLKTERLIWNQNQIKDWLDLYKAKKPHKENWCDNFYEQFASLEDDDERRKIFAVPIILYICGTSQTDIKDHSSIGSIYRDAFTKILLRKHLKGQSNTDELKEKDKETNMTAWQFTKELAYQMSLLETLDLVDDDTSTNRRAVGFRNARKRTEDILKGKEYNIGNPVLELKRELAVCPFAKEKGNGGITFAHKTVYEYFTAVKLYEDYFARFDSDYFKDQNEDTAAMEVMESFIEAFRYDGISDDIFSYLCEMKNLPFSTTLGYSKNKGLNYKKYEQKFVYAMQNHIYAEIGIKPAIKEYLYSPYFKYDIEENYRDWKSKSIEAQTDTAFANLTWFLSRQGFRNEEKSPECMLICNFIHNSLKGAYLENWYLDGENYVNANLADAHLKGADLTGADLTGADLTSVDLTNADLTDTDLKYVHLKDANLKNANLTDVNLTDVNLTDVNLTDADLTGANLTDTDLTDANLTGANLKNANLTDANLTGANLTDANLAGAKYCNNLIYKTIFPNGFDPKEHNMIEVDSLGNPVKDE